MTRSLAIASSFSMLLLLLLLLCAGCSITSAVSRPIGPSPAVEPDPAAYGSVAPDAAAEGAAADLDSAAAAVADESAPAMTPADEEAEKVWSGLAELSASATGGNTRTEGIDARAEVNADWKGDRLLTYARVEWAQSQDEDTGDDDRLRNRQTAGAKYEHDITDRFYGFAREDLEKDEFQDLKLRTVTTVGAGYQILDEEAHKLSADAGIGYETDDYYDDDNEDFMVGTAAERWEWKISESWAFIESVELISNLRDYDDDFRTVSKADLRNQLTKNLFLSFGFEHRYYAEPARDDNGDRNNRQDWIASIKIGWTF